MGHKTLLSNWLLPESIILFYPMVEPTLLETVMEWPLQQMFPRAFFLLSSFSTKNMWNTMSYILYVCFSQYAAALQLIWKDYPGSVVGSQI